MTMDINRRKLSTSSGQFRHAKRSFFKRLQIVEWLPNYGKIDLISDFVAGLTVGMMMIPQSIAYAGLASLPAQYGLYTAFIGSFTYVVFGSIKQVSIGPTSLMALLTFMYCEGYSVDYVILLTFLAGLVELIMGLLNLGFLVDFISPAVSAGFTSAISIIIIASQLKSLFGLKIVYDSFLGMLWKLAVNMKNIKISDTVLGLCSIAFLVTMKNLPKIKSSNKVFNKTLWFLSISRNASIVIITSTVAFYFCKSYGSAPFVLSGKVPSGLPNFQLPNFSTTHNNQTVSFYGMLQTLGSGIIVVPISAILSNVAIAKSFSSGVIVDASQEMISLGLCNILGSCIQAMPSGGAFSRSAVANSSGVRTPMQGIFSGFIIVMALSFLTPYFSFIPKATLAAVLIAAVATMIEYEILPILWRTNKIDFSLCVLTSTVGVIYGASFGIMIGTGLNVLVLVKEWSRPNIAIHINTWENDSRAYISVQPEIGLFYPARDYLTEKVMEANSHHPDLPIVIDCSRILKIDHAGAEALNNLLIAFNGECDKLFLINVNSQVNETLKNFSGMEKMKNCESKSEMFSLFSKNETKIPLLTK